MDKKNLTLFLGVIAIMVAMVAYDTISSGIDIEKKGLPAVRPPFSQEDYNISFTEDAVVLDLSSTIVDEYEGKFLSVYAYNEEGNHVFTMKRVVNGKIIIGRNEAAGFKAFLSEDGIVLNVEKGSREELFYEILKEAESENRFFGLEKCLLGKQCVSICPVAAIEVLRKDPDPEGRGRIIPDIFFDKCIQGGLCSSVCPTNFIVIEGDPRLQEK